MNKKSICVSSKKNCLTDNNKTAHWVGQSKLKPLDTDYFQKKKFIDDIQASLTDTAIEQSTSGRKKIHICYRKTKNKNLKRRMMMLM